LAVGRRLQGLRLRLAERGLDAIIVTKPEDCRYISGFTGSSGPVAMLLLSPDRAVLATDFIHLEQARQEASGFAVVPVNSSSRRFTELLSGGRRPGKVGFEADVVPVAEFRRLSEEAEKAGVELVPTEGIVDSLRVAKDEEEISCILRAAFIADTAMKHIAARIHPGMTEKEAAWEVERCLRENGSEPLPFDIIVASGPNAALPHAKPTDRPISEGEPVIFDIGARWKGYCSDLSRTLCLGPGPDRFRAVYDLVLQAQMAALDGIQAGMTGAQADGVARAVIDAAGYRDAFGHGLGHGVGLAVHERPRVSANSTDVIEENMVFTVEPGVYIVDWGGVRIEDTVVIRNGRAHTLTRAGKDAQGEKPC
jgi:Xaa-Pro aminopeptidase